MTDMFTRPLDSDQKDAVAPADRIGATLTPPLPLFPELSVPIAKRQSTSTSPYLEVEGDLPLDMARGTLVSLTREPAHPIYALGFQPAKSVPELCRWFFRKYLPRGGCILEPFAGGGTTLVEAVMCGVSADWLDYLPLSRLICRVKTHRFEPGEVLRATAAVIRNASSSSPAPRTVEFSNRDFWFQPSVQEALELLKAGITVSPPLAAPVMWLAFGATVRKMSDMNDGMLLAARRPGVTPPPRRAQAEVFHHFGSTVRAYCEAISAWLPILSKSPSMIRELSVPDARFIPATGQYDAIVTSPPYINAIDYVWASKFELHWLDMVRSNKERLELYSREIGTERIPSHEYNTIGRSGLPQLDQIIADIFHGSKYKASVGQNKLRSRVVYQYFMDMRQHLSTAFESLRPGGYYFLSIGEASRICGIEVPVAQLLITIAKQLGYHECLSFKLLLKRRKLNIPRNVNWAGTIRHDSIVVLQRP